jgi:hypothetical protein
MIPGLVVVDLSMIFAVVCVLVGVACLLLETKEAMEAHASSPVYMAATRSLTGTKE